jgi:hypothetical protein
MSASIPLIVGALIGVAAGSLLVPVTRRELAAAVVRTSKNTPETQPGEALAAD